MTALLTGYDYERESIRLISRGQLMMRGPVNLSGGLIQVSAAYGVNFFSQTSMFSAKSIEGKLGGINIGSEKGGIECKDLCDL